MKKSIFILLLALLSSSLAASAATKTINPGKISKISVSTGVKLHFTKGTTTQVRLEADRDIFSEVDVTTQSGLLSIVNNAKTYTNNGSNSETLSVWVTAPEVTSFKATVGSSITIENSSYSVSSPLNIDISVGSSFHANSLSASSITLKNTVGSTTSVTDLKSEGDLALENTVGSKMTVNDIVAKGVFDFTSGPSGNTTITSVSASNANLKFGPTDHFDIRKNISSKYLTISGSTNATIGLNGINAELVDARGAYGCDINLAGKTDQLILYGNRGSINSSKLEHNSIIKNSDRTVNTGPAPSSSDYDFDNYADYYQYYADYYKWAADYYRNWADYYSNSGSDQYNGYVKSYLNSAKYYDKEAEKYKKLANTALEKYSANLSASGKRSKSTATTRSKTSNKGLSLPFSAENGTVNYGSQSWNEYATKNEKRQTSTLKTGTIKEIKASSGISVNYRQGPLKPVEITTPESRKNDISVYMEGTTLNIEKVKGNSWKDEFVVTVQAPDVASFDFSSGCTLTFTDDYSISGNFNLDMSSGSTFKASSVAASDILIDLSSGSRISLPVLKASGNVYVDLSSGCNFSAQNIDAKTKAVFDFSSGVNGNLGNLKAPMCVANLSSGCSVSGSQIIADELQVIASSAAKATLSGIQAGDIIASASSVSTINLAGKCNHLTINQGVLSNSDYYGYDSKGRIDINNLEVKNGITSNTRNNRVYNNANRNYYNYNFDSDLDDDEDIIIRSSATDSDRPKTEKEKVADAVKALKDLGLTDEQIKRALSNSGLDTDLIETKTPAKSKTTKKAKKEYTEDDLVP